MRIIHLGTELKVHFGVLHESGDVTDHKPFVFSLPTLTVEAFLALLPHIKNKREQMRQEADRIYQSNAQLDDENGQSDS